jgi:GAF domain-containing protein
MIALLGYHTMVVEQIGILTRRSRVTREARALTTNQMLTISLNITLLQSLSMSTSIPNHNYLYPNIEIIY